MNVVPDELVATFDVRISPLLELKEFENRVNKWIAEAGDGVEIDYYQKHMDQASHRDCLAFKMRL